MRKAAWQERHPPVEDAFRDIVALLRGDGCLS